ncbi:MBL fold metallo-hydrolase [candidate division NPL-UPA2 bacterium Unc8]|uniref:Ribonuclease J n=2 Tax=Bacteria TaxID=2 RepID=A0A9E2F108_PSYF1|nr:Ribonuclease J [Candidatus Psychracetigena formicireducens]RIH99928.1 MAG: MBL fold metallo-hydrolase [candidate division NPL-UPA2 bacterium Unc8]
MQLIIHRGTQEIGGSCVELSAANSRILIDFGMPLVNKNKERFDPDILKGKSVEELKELSILPKIKGLYKNENKSIDAILISHSHMDHYGLLSYVHADIPIYLSEGAKELVDITNLFLHKEVKSFNAKLIKNKETLVIGDFKITPYLVDHSAFDALAFLIEADGSRLFYSGDFRGHGRKSVLFKQMIENPPKDIDCLLMEGSMLGRSDRLYNNEEEIEKRIVEILKESRTATFLFASSQNIDRLVSAYRACLKTDSIFVIDLYTAYILDKLNKISKGIPRFDRKNIRVKFMKYHADVLAKNNLKSLLYLYNERKIDMDELNEKRDKILMLARDNSVFPLILKNINAVKGAKIIYSMWDGYLTEEFRFFCNEQGLLLESVHTSGHAELEDLKKFANALNPKKLIPIHTFDTEKYPELFKNVQILEDGEAIEL